MKAIPKPKTSYAKIRRLKAKALRLWHQVILAQNPKCLLCGNPATEGHHLIPRSLSSCLAYDLENGVPLCRACHFKAEKQRDPMVVMELMHKVGRERWDYLALKRRENPTFKLTLNYLQLKEIELEEDLELLE